MDTEVVDQSCKHISFFGSLSIKAVADVDQNIFYFTA